MRNLAIDVEALKVHQWRKIEKTKTEMKMEGKFFAGERNSFLLFAIETLKITK